MSYNQKLDDVVKSGLTIDKLRTFRNALYQRRWYYKDVLKQHKEGTADGSTMSINEAGMRLMQVNDVIGIVNKLMVEIESAVIKTSHINSST